MINFLNNKQKKLRLDFINLLIQNKKYHIGGSLSCLDIMVCLFYKFIDLKKKNRDFFLLSKGHALANLYLIMLDQKLIQKRKFFEGFNTFDLGGQLDVFKYKELIDWNTGSLGHSLGIAIGLAIGNPKKKIWTIIGDAEIDEGSVWEALFFISEKKINNINIIIDRNKLSASSKMEKKEIFDKNFFKNLSLKSYVINGHNTLQLINCFSKIKKKQNSTIIIANTIKGKGFYELENNLKFSHHIPNQQTLKKIFTKINNV